MDKKEAIQKGIDELNSQEPISYEQQQQDLLQKRKDDARPALLKRIAAGLLDFLFDAALAGGLFAIAYFTIFPAVGYQSSSQLILQNYETSHLYVRSETTFGYDLLTSHYDDNKTPEENYDVPITYFYSNNLRAFKENKLEEYTNRKVESGYYYIDENNECKRKESVNRDIAKSFLEKEYNTAVEYLFKDPEIINATRILSYTIPVTVLTVTIIACAVFNFTFPLLDKKRRTFGYVILQIMPVRSEDLLTPERSKIALRSFMFVIINYISVITIGLFLSAMGFAFIPFFLNTIILCFSHSNSGLHDYGSKIIVINESYSNALSSLKQMLGQEEGEVKNEYTTSKR